MPQIHPKKHVAGTQYILYDANKLSDPGPELFDPAYWAEQGALEGQALGRGTTHFIRAAKGCWVLRHYRRGGLVARVVKDRYCGFRPECSRSFREWQLLVDLYERGLPVPRPVAASVSQGLFTYRADIITEKISGTTTLAETLKVAALAPDAWERVGSCIRSLHDVECFHADLNAMNILLDNESAVYLIDFDRARYRASGSWKSSNLERLQRSLLKLGRLNQGFNFNSLDWKSLLSGYYRS